MDTDQYYTLLNEQDIILTSCLKRMDRAVAQVVSAALENQFWRRHPLCRHPRQPRRRSGPYHDFDEQIPDRLKREIMDIQRRILEGTLASGWPEEKISGSRPMKTSRFARLFGERSTAVIGMIHVRALPGAPGHAGGMGPILDQALAEADIYRLRLRALMIENMHDVPYVRRPGPVVLAAMAVLAREVKRAHPAVPLGIQILAGANREALSAALAAGADFIRAEGVRVRSCRRRRLHRRLCRRPAAPPQRHRRRALPFSPTSRKSTPRMPSPPTWILCRPRMPPGSFCPTG